MPRLAALAALLVLAGLAAGVARADGDPASDVLPSTNVYLPLSRPSPDAAAALRKAVSDVYDHGRRLKVAVIATEADLGAIPSLFDKPTEYARFLGIEIASLYVGPLLIVMPSGYGIYDGGRTTAAESAVLEHLSVDRSSPDTLAHSAADAVRKLLAANALDSRDITAPSVYPVYRTIRGGRPARLSYRAIDDSEQASVTLTVAAKGRTIATFHRAMQPAVYAKARFVTWAVPKAVPPKGVKLCATAVDPSGNRSRPACILLALG